MKLQGCNPLLRPYFLGGNVTLQVISLKLHDGEPVMSQLGWVEFGRRAEKGPLKIDALEDDISFELWGFWVTVLVFVGVAGGLRLMTTTSHDVICWVLLGRWTCTRWRRSARGLEDQHHCNGYHIEIYISTAYF